MNMQKNIEKMFDTIDSACKFLFEKKINYLEGLFISTEYLMQGQVDIDIGDEEYLELTTILDELEGLDISVEVARKAMQFLILNALKEMKIPNHYMTPEAVCLFVSYLAKKFINYPKKVLDLGIGTGNLLTTIANNFEEAELYGIDSDEVMVKIAKMNTSMQNLECYITLGDALTTPYHDMDLIIADIDKAFIEEKCFAHELVKTHWLSLNYDGYMILIVPNDFFDYPKFELEHMQMIGLVELPNMGAKKSIIIIHKTDTKVKEFLMVQLPSFTEYEKMEDCITKIEQWFKRREENV